MSNRTQEYSYQVPCIDGSPGCDGPVKRTVKGLSGLDSDQLLEIRDKGTVTLAEADVLADDVVLTPDQEKALLQNGKVSVAANFNVDHASCESCGSNG